VELEEGIEGLVHVSEAGRHKGKSLRELYSLGDVISAKVINVSVHDRKIGLSIKRLKKDEEQSFYSEYMDSGSDAGTTSLGEQLQQALSRAAAEAGESGDSRETEEEAGEDREAATEVEGSPEEPATEEPAAAEPATEEPATEEPAAEEAAAEESAEEPPADEAQESEEITEAVSDESDEDDRR
jgi:predicted RNA-binding protein with RPS1 domain